VKIPKLTKIYHLDKDGHVLVTLTRLSLFIMTHWLVNNLELAVGRSGQKD
jgi:hypothetical protein